MGKPGKSKRPAARGRLKMIAHRKAFAISMAERMIAELWRDDEIDLALAKQFKITKSTAANIRKLAWGSILAADTSTREERFALMVGSLRALYRAAFDAGNHAACAGVLRQMREMYDLLEPLPGGSGKIPESKHAHRTEKDLEHFAVHGVWPSMKDEKKTEERQAVANPLDDLA
jgi:hypothetical protein